MENDVSTVNMALLDLALEYSASSHTVLRAIRSAQGEILDFEFLFLNKQAQVDAQRFDLPGKRLLQEFPKTQPGLFTFCCQVIQSGAEWEGELQMDTDTENWSELTIKKYEDYCIITCHRTSNRQELARKATNKYLSLFNSIEEGFCVVELVFDEHQVPVDYRFLETNPSFALLTGLRNVVGKTVRELLPGHEAHWFRQYGLAQLSTTPRHFEVQVAALGRWFDAYAFKIEESTANNIGVIFTDITGRKQNEEHQAYLLELSDTLQKSTTSRELKTAAGQLITEKLGLTGTIFFIREVHQNGISFRVSAHDGMVADFSKHAVSFDQVEQGMPTLLKGKPAVLNDVRNELPNHAQSIYLQNQIQALVAIPLFQKNQCEGFFVAYRDQPTVWQENDIQLVRETAARVWEITARLHTQSLLQDADKMYRTKLEEEVKQRTRELRDSRDFVTAITRTVPELITIHDVATTKMIYYNQEQTWASSFVENGIAELTGEERANLVIYPDDLPKAQSFVKERALLADNAVAEIELRAKLAGGIWGWIRVVSKIFKRNTDGTASQIISVTTNITEQKQNELNFREQANFINNITKTIPDLVVVVDLLSRKVIYYNDDPTALTGYNREELDTMDPKERHVNTIIEEDRHIIESFYKRLTQMTTDEVIVAEYRFRKKGGGVFWMRVRGKVYLRDDAGRPVRSLQIGQDITAEKESHQKIREVLEQFQNLVNNTPDTITRWNSALELVFANPAFAVKTRMQEKTLVGKTIAQMNLPEELAVPWMEKLRQVFKTAEATEIYNVFPTPQGSSFYYTRMVPELSEDGKVSTVLAIARDVSQLKETEKELSNLRLQQQKKILNAIIMTQEKERKRIGEELHDGVGQLLYGALAKVQSFKNVDPSKMNEVLDIVQEAIKDVRSISFELVPAVLKDHGLEVALRSLFQRVLPQHLEVVLSIENLHHRLPEKLEFAIYRIVQELVNNTVKHAKASMVYIRIVSEAQGHRLKVRDNGRGFDISKIDPMSGGIGLQSIKNRVKLLGGHIEMRSGSTGTQVEIFLPKD